MCICADMCCLHIIIASDFRSLPSLFSLFPVFFFVMSKKRIKDTTFLKSKYGDEYNYFNYSLA